MGEEAAYAHVSDLLAAGIRSGPTLADSYYALFLRMMTMGTWAMGLLINVSLLKRLDDMG